MNHPKAHTFPKKGRHIALWGGFLLLVLSACTRGNVPLPSPAPTTTPLPQARFTFEVTLPPNTPPDEGVNLVVLDEITGLALNARPHPMQAVDATHYRLELSLPLHSVLKYRYERRGASLSFPEYTADGKQVRYRLLRVSTPMHIQDKVARWVDTPFTGATGRIQGRIVDAESGRPLPDMLILCAGAQTRSLADGSFFLENLPAGVHWLSVYAPDGNYAPFQQQADIAPQATTPVFVQLQARPTVAVTFIVTPPPDIPATFPIRMVGNLRPLGNTFTDLQGGMSHTAIALPSTHTLPDGRHTLTLHLPVGADLHYRYTLGDGYWNAEHNADGTFRTRRLLVPDHDTTIQDDITTWYDGPPGYLTFDVRTPPETPADETVTLQLSLFGWMEPLPMWQVEPNHWTYFIFSPRQGLETLHYRYCRNAQCGLLDAADTPGTLATGHVLDVRQASTPGHETITTWQWWQSAREDRMPEFEPASRGPYFATGLAFTPAYHPSWTALYPQALERAAQDNARWVVFSPTWRFTHNQPPVLEPHTEDGFDRAAWKTLNFEAQSRGMHVALYPQPQAPVSATQWWQSPPLDETWWSLWFETYRRFALHHAYLAEQSGVQTLILGGPWTSPALPGSPQAPPDAEARWRSLLEEVRAAYTGEVRWALPYASPESPLPPFLDAVDGVYILWSLPLTDKQTPPGWRTLSEQAGGYLDALYARLPQTSVWLGVNVPSAVGSIQGCIPAPEGGCLPAERLLLPPTGLQSLPVDLDMQVRALQALAFTVENRPWVDGFFVRGTYPAGNLQGPGASVFGKPAEALLRNLFSLW